MTVKQLKRQIIRDFAVECGDEFDRNFVRKAFFDKPWAPVKVYNHRGSLLLRTGALRSSLHYQPTDTGVRVTSDTPYASIHNDGGMIDRHVAVTPQMRRWAWARYYATKNNRYKGLALTQKRAIRQHIRMPARPFVGDHPILRRSLDAIAGKNIRTFSEKLFNTLKK